MSKEVLFGLAVLFDALLFLLPLGHLIVAVAGHLPFITAFLGIIECHDAFQHYFALEFFSVQMEFVFGLNQTG